MDMQIDTVAAPDANWVKDGTTESFDTDVVKASADRLVLVDLWAPWCGPCKQLGPLLEKVVNSAGGAVTMVKVDIDQNPQIAQALRVQSIPAVFAFKNGQPVDGFMGAVPESKIKEFIEKNMDGSIGPSPVEAGLESGVEAFEADNIEGALTAFAEVLELDPENVDAKAHLSRVYIKLGETEAAQSLLEEIQETHKDNANVSAAVAALSLALNAADEGELAPLMKQIDGNPDDLDARFELAKGLIGNESYEDGGAQLIEIIKRDREWNENAARAELLKMFEALGQMHEITQNFRGQLSSVLFS